MSDDAERLARLTVEIQALLALYTSPAADPLDADLREAVRRLEGLVRDLQQHLHARAGIRWR